MKNLSPKVKRAVMFVGIGLVCVGCLSLVMIHANAGEETESASSESSAEIILGTPNPVSIPEISSEAGTGSAFAPSSGAQASAPLTTVSKPTSTPSKPAPPASSALTDKSKKPTYSSKPTASKSTTTKQKSAAGYSDPVFGNQVGTGGQAISVPDYGGDIHKQVGTMD
ncbi:hypothetical protein EQM14_04770 [Caproiciproducens sp. NJN-50]|uniref:hypothetical protein n=1 Tax=Caproiciproducens sp. NJN-50 TaxID=2507162 RepID=UPI000FFE135B|nr:hypothetical protein [Caproiciproducens sp. NJN-50]QAT49141.1 hypothetical protein EQM14_04770 [Caproiciproducens sp. NJN-50]